MISSLAPLPRKIVWYLLGSALVLASTGCATRQQASDSFLGLVTPYRIDIVQGNAVTREQAARVKPGMTRAQVRDLLGSPMLTDLFHADRWDYIFMIRRPGADAQRRNVIAFFEGDILKRLDVPDALPTENEFVAAIAPPTQRAKVRGPLELTEEQRKALPRPPPPAAPDSAPGGPTRDYPPLEPK